MYNLQDYYNKFGKGYLHELWNGKMACAFFNGARTMTTNEMTESLNCYTFTLITQGEMVLLNGNTKLSFYKNDIYTYYPGTLLSIVDVSDDFEAISLMVDEQIAHNAQAFRNLLRASMVPISQFGNSKLSLTSGDANRVKAVLMLISEYISRPMSLKNEILEMLYSVFINDLISIAAFEKAQLSISRQAEEIFISFYELLQKNYIEQHNIRFYADTLNITTTYLSRIVKSISGRTVIECINEMLAIEATWLIKSTNLTVAQIADRLNFSTSAAFDKFYKRMRGSTPSDFRKRQK
ncbi:MAG: AraC family transcriptional regulator [Muribaculaceae bacterium]|nr:AraC family transcriptional regulator [Muribaculaceae bacterium]